MPIIRIAIRALLAVALTAVFVVVPVGAASAGPGVTQVDGLMVPDGGAACDDDAASIAAYVVSGSLVGCWYIDTFVVEHTSNAGGFLASGTEQFAGCLGSRCGRFFTTYTFTAKFTGDTEDHGRCHHPVVGGDGDFAGVTGVINMHDLPDGCSIYSGHLSS